MTRSGVLYGVHDRCTGLAQGLSACYLFYTPVDVPTRATGPCVGVMAAQQAGRL